MAIDVPARIAVLGAGPIGLEAALYARFLGYDVQVYERGEVAHHVRQWGHVTMFSPFRFSRSTLGLAALAAHDPSWKRPQEDTPLTGRQWAERYLIPLSQTDLLVDAIRLRTEAIAVSREGAIKTDDAGSDPCDRSPFRILLRGADGQEQTASADVVIDSTGVFGNPNPMGAGGIPAVGESNLRDRIRYGLPDVLGCDRHEFAGRHTLVVGAGCSAATTVVALSQLSQEAPGTRVTWVVRRQYPPDAKGPIDHIPHQLLVHRDRLVQQASHCATGGQPQVTFLPGTMVHAVQWEEDQGQLGVQLTSRNQGLRPFDQIVCQTGFRPDVAMCRELHVHPCYITEGPSKLAAWLSGPGSREGPDQPCAGGDTLCLPEPNFYILGSKSYGRHSSFLFAAGLDQIRRLFTVIGDRANLDLYANMDRLISAGPFSSTSNHGGGCV